MRIILIIVVIAFSSQHSNDQCDTKCVSKFGTVIGVNNNVEAYSNCNDGCISKEFHFIDLPNKKKIFTGLKWQCVEYARRYLILSNNITFGDIDSAYQIYDLKTASSVYDSKRTFKFMGYPNGSKEPPKKNDLLIFKKTKDSPYGHVAVITNVNLSERYIEICEENNNQKWIDPKAYSRRIVIEEYKGGYYIRETEYFPYRLDSHIAESYSNVIGWKRVVTDN